MLSVAEHFLSIQGEGPSAGIPAVFLRLAGCNLMCGGHGTENDKKLHDGATWRCDTIEVWKKGRRYQTLELVNEFQEKNYDDAFFKGAHLVVTGGEPLLQDRGIADFITSLSRDGQTTPPVIEIETNGTLVPSNALLDAIKQVGKLQINCSPKLSNSGMSTDDRLKTESLTALRNLGAYFKFVVSEECDVHEIAAIVDHYGILPERVYLMPAADCRLDLIWHSEMVARAAIERGYRFSSRHQVMIWDKTTGV